MARREAQIIRGDDQTIPVPVAGVFGDLIGATAKLFVTPVGAAASNTFEDPAAVITSTVGPFVTQPTELEFELTSQEGQPNSSLIPLKEYSWYARVQSADGKLTSIAFTPDTVEVVAPGEGDC